MFRIITADKTELYVKDWGTSQPMILIHGWPLSSDSWDDQAMALANAGYRAIAYDRRGFGRSTQPWSGYDYDTLADDPAAVIEQTGMAPTTRWCPSTPQAASRPKALHTPQYCSHTKTHRTACLPGTRRA